MKKFAKILGLCAAFGMMLTMSVSAVGSTSTDNTDANKDAAAEAQKPAVEMVANVKVDNKVIIDGKEVELEIKVTPVKKAVVTEAVAEAKKLVKETAVVMKAFDIELPKGDYSKGVQITMSVPNVVAGQDIAVLHQKADGTWESVKVNKVVNGAVTATFTSFSPVAIVAKDAAPKTGATVPATMVVAVLALAGAAVCYKKYND